MLSRMQIRCYDDFKRAITEAVASRGSTRSALANDMDSKGILRAHTVKSLLGSPGTVIGRRKPAFDSILKIAHAAGFNLTLTPKEP
jgi:DNA-binding phage protein